MKLMFVEAAYTKQVLLPKAALAALPNSLVLVSSVQFIRQLPAVKKQLESAGRTVYLGQGSHARHAGQILGCSTTLEVKGDFDAFLYIGDGMFHPKALLIKHNKPLFTFDPIHNFLKHVSSHDVDTLRKRAKGALLRFLAADEVGILVTTKPGQLRLRQANTIKKHFKDKHFSIIVFDTLDFGSLEDFPFIECFINTACPRMGYDDSEKYPKPVLAMEDLAVLMGQDLRF